MKFLLLEYLVLQNKLDDFKEWLKNEGIEAENELDSCVDKLINFEPEISDNPFE